MTDKNPMLDVFLREYDKVKGEQKARIAFRDNLVYVTLVSYGAFARDGSGDRTDGSVCGVLSRRAATGTD